MSFEHLQLKPVLLKAIKKCGYSAPTPIQEEAIPKVLIGCDIIASANTGTGKTASFVLPALQHLTSRHAKKTHGKPSVLILTPTRELAQQVSQAIRKYGKFVNFQSVTLFGGMPYGPQLKSLSKLLDIVVATPGRLIDHIERRSIDLSGIDMLVLDEADRMLDMGFIDEVNKIVDLTPAHRQTLFFTATWDNTLANLAKRLLKEPHRIQIETQPTQHNIEQRLHLADNLEHKSRILHHLLGDSALKQAIIFSATKQGADELAQRLVAQGHAAAALHGDMKQSVRNRTLTSLRDGKLRLLVATDVAARGIDVMGVSHVINFDLPRFAEDYIHRIGRTGRAGTLGTAISFVLPDDLPHLKRIERYLGKIVPHHTIPGLEPNAWHRPATQNKKRKSSTTTAAAPSRKKYLHSVPKSNNSKSFHTSPYRRRNGPSSSVNKKAVA